MNFPRRESSYRKAKSKAHDFTSMISRNEDDEPAEYAGDSDEDPAWTPTDDRVSDLLLNVSTMSLPR